MMEFSEVIEKRVSVRGFEDKEVGEEIIDKIVRDGDMSPSAGNVHGFEFIKICAKDTIKALAQTTYRGNKIESSEYQNWIETAPVIIVLLYEKTSMFKKYGQRGLDKYIYLDGSAAMENMLLSAVDNGLGACYISGFREDKVKEILKIPDEYELIGFIPLGYPKESEGINKRKKRTSIKIHKDYFNE